MNILDAGIGSTTTLGATMIEHCSVSARPESLGVIDDPLFENLGVIGKFRGSELFYNFICLRMRLYKGI